MNQITEFQGEHRFLSNFWPCQILLDGHYYRTVEHAYQAAKTDDLQTRDLIASVPSPSFAKRIGHRITLRAGWNDIRLEVMRSLVWKKFTYPGLRQMLLATGTAELIEGNTWGDTFWGVCNGVGENNLGHILMNIRERIQD